jgi:VanZ family protein
MGLLLKRSEASSNANEVQIKNSILVNGLLRLTQVESEVESKAEKHLRENGAKPRWLLHFFTALALDLSAALYVTIMDA